MATKAKAEVQAVLAETQAVEAETEAVTQASKVGYLTTEFWVTVLPIVGIFILLIIGKVSIDDVGSLWPIFTGGGAYAIGRSVIKMRAT